MDTEKPKDADEIAAGRRARYLARQGGNTPPTEQNVGVQHAGESDVSATDLGGDQTGRATEEPEKTPLWLRGVKLPPAPDTSESAPTPPFELPPFADTPSRPAIPAHDGWMPPPPPPPPFNPRYQDRIVDNSKQGDPGDADEGSPRMIETRLGPVPLPPPVPEVMRRALEEAETRKLAAASNSPQSVGEPAESSSRFVPPPPPPTPDTRIEPFDPSAISDTDDNPGSSMRDISTATTHVLEDPLVPKPLATTDPDAPKLSLLGDDDLPDWVGQDTNAAPAVVSESDDRWMTQIPNTPGYVDEADKQAVLLAQEERKTRQAERSSLPSSDSEKLVAIQEIRNNEVGFTAAEHSVAARYRETAREGKRNNEDTTFLDAQLKVAGLFDGMGGQGHGDEASQTARDRVRIAFSSSPPRTLQEAQQRMWHALHEADTSIRNAQDGRGSTGTVMYIHQEQTGERYMVVGNVADSRVYVLRNNRLIPLTIDNSSEYPTDEDRTEQCKKDNFVKIETDEEWRYFKSPYFGRHVVSNALGHGEFKPFIGVYAIQPGDKFFSMCDDIYENFTYNTEPDGLEQFLRQFSSPAEAVKATIAEAKEKSKRDKAVYPRAKDDDASIQAIFFDEAPATHESHEKQLPPEEVTRNVINRMAEQLNWHLLSEGVRQDMERRMNEAVREIYAGSRVTEFGTNNETGPYMYVQYVRRGQTLPEEFNTFAARHGEVDISPDGSLATSDVLRFLVLGSGIQRSLQDADISPSLETPSRLANIVRWYLQLENTHPVLTQFIGRHKEEFEAFLHMYSR